MPKIFFTKLFFMMTKRVKIFWLSGYLFTSIPWNYKDEVILYMLIEIPKIYSSKN